jgi:hypothetical protein
MYQMVIKIPNWDFWFENKPSGNLGLNNAMKQKQEKWKKTDFLANSIADKRQQK